MCCVSVCDMCKHRKWLCDVSACECLCVCMSAVSCLVCDGV